MSVTCTNVNAADFGAACASLPITKEHLDFYTGFRYASTLDATEDDARFILAKDADRVVGILKYARFADRGYAHVAEGVASSHLGIYYLDVHEDYRQQGVSKALVSALRQTTSPPHIVELSPLTPSGRRGKVVETFQHHFTVRRVGT